MQDHNWSTFDLVSHALQHEVCSYITYRSYLHVYNNIATLCMHALILIYYCIRFVHLRVCLRVCVCVCMYLLLNFDQTANSIYISSWIAR